MLVLVCLVPARVDPIPCASAHVCSCVFACVHVQPVQCATSRRSCCCSSTSRMPSRATSSRAPPPTFQRRRAPPSSCIVALPYAALSFIAVHYFLILRRFLDAACCSYVCTVLVRVRVQVRVRVMQQVFWFDTLGYLDITSTVVAFT